jgi:hypothetical protein
LLATSGPERPGFRKQREREDHATAWSRAGESAADRANLGSPWQRSHELEGKKGKFWAGTDPVLFARSEALGRLSLSSWWTKKGQTGKTGGWERWRFRGSLNWSARSFHDVPGTRWGGLRLVFSRHGRGNFGLCPIRMRPGVISIEVTSSILGNTLDSYFSSFPRRILSARGAAGVWLGCC